MTLERKFSLADKAYYVSEYLAELSEVGKLVSRTACEKYAHTTPPCTGLELNGHEVLAWAQEIGASLDRRRKKRPKSSGP
jgi:hypothetical protein